jgi:hypothetical protein
MRHARHLTAALLLLGATSLPMSCSSSRSSVAEPAALPDVSSGPQQVSNEFAPGAVQLGSGFNSLTGEVKAISAVEVDPRNVTQDASGAADLFTRQFTESTEQLYKFLGIKASAGVQGIGWNAEAKAEYAAALSTDGYTSSLAVSRKVVVGADRLQPRRFELTRDARRVLEREGVEGFYRQFGDSFVVTMLRGGELWGLIQVENQSSSQKESFDSSAKAAIGAFDGSMEVAKRLSQVISGRSSRVHFRAVGAPPGSAPTSFDMLDAKIQDFAQQVTTNRGTAAIVGIVVVPFSSLPELQRVGARFDTRASRQALEELGTLRVRLRGERDNLRYVLGHAGQFPDLNSDEVTAQLSEADRRLSTVEDAISATVASPFGQPPRPAVDMVASYRPSWKLRNVVPIAREITNDPNVRGRVIGFQGTFPRTSGDEDVDSDDHVTERRIHSTLKPVGNTVTLEVRYYVKETVPDHTIFRGTQSATLYTAPSGWTVRSIRTRDGALVFARNTPSSNYDFRGEEHGFKQVDAGTSYWESLRLCADTGEDNDRPAIGVRGLIKFDVEIIEN